jgi:hypothetical protein
VAGINLEQGVESVAQSFAFEVLVFFTLSGSRLPPYGLNFPFSPQELKKVILFGDRIFKEVIKLKGDC